MTDDPAPSLLPVPLPSGSTPAPSLPRPTRSRLLPERSDFLEVDEPAADKVRSIPGQGPRHHCVQSRWHRPRLGAVDLPTGCSPTIRSRPTAAISSISCST